MNAPQRAAARAKRGDLVVITGHRVGEPERVGEILEVLGEPAHAHYNVRWQDGHESTVYPGSDMTIRPSSRRRKPHGEES